MDLSPKSLPFNYLKIAKNSNNDKHHQFEVKVHDPYYPHN